MANPQVGNYVNRHFVSAVQKVGTFQIVGGVKVGGNVATYFCTADGLVLHCVAGPALAPVFQKEASWACDTYQLALLENHKTVDQLRAFFREAHLKRLQTEHRVSLPADRLPQDAAANPKALRRLVKDNHRLFLNHQGEVHLLLAVAPLPRMDQVYRVVFEDILNEKVSTNPVAGAGK